MNEQNDAAPVQSVTERRQNWQTALAYFNWGLVEGLNLPAPLRQFAYKLDEEVLRVDTIAVLEDAANIDAFERYFVLLVQQMRELHAGEGLDEREAA